MTLLELLFLLLIAAIAGGLGQALSGYSLGGCLISIVVGFIGAFLGLGLARWLALPEPKEGADKPDDDGDQAAAEGISGEGLAQAPSEIGRAHV